MDKNISSETSVVEEIAVVSSMIPVSIPASARPKKDTAILAV